MSDRTPEAGRTDSEMSYDEAKRWLSGLIEQAYGSTWVKHNFHAPGTGYGTMPMVAVEVPLKDSGEPQIDTNALKQLMEARCEVSITLDELYGSGTITDLARLKGSWGGHRFEVQVEIGKRQVKPPDA